MEIYGFFQIPYPNWHTYNSQQTWYAMVANSNFKSIMIADMSQCPMTSVHIDVGGEVHSVSDWWDFGVSQAFNDLLGILELV